MRIHRERLVITTGKSFDVIVVTADVDKVLLASGIEEGFVLVYSKHTTCGVVINEKETGLLSDIHKALCEIVPEHGAYLHNDWNVRTENMQEDETPNAHAHIRHLLAGRSSECVPVNAGSLDLGIWQRIMVVEFDRARNREILIQVSGI
ncbi:MAG: secondary thiamine-phosphate synthase enzyme YjbQ [Actinomycetota bacterium]